MTTHPADDLYERLRADLRAAMKAGHAEAVSALRTLIAALDNAGAVAAPSEQVEPQGEHVAGAASGVGATEVPRRELTSTAILDIIGEQVRERLEQAEAYEAVGEHAAASRLGREAEVLHRYLGA